MDSLGFDAQRIIEREQEKMRKIQKNFTEQNNIQKSQQKNSHCKQQFLFHAMT